MCPIIPYKELKHFVLLLLLMKGSLPPSLLRWSRIPNERPITVASSFHSACHLDGFDLLGWPNVLKFRIFRKLYARFCLTLRISHKYFCESSLDAFISTLPFHLFLDALPLVFTVLRHSSCCCASRCGFRIG